MTQKALNIDQKTEILQQFAGTQSPLIELAQKIGPAAFDVLLQTLGGEKPHIPRIENFWNGLQRDIRNTTIRNRYRPDLAEQIALELGLSAEQVRRIANPSSTRTPSLPERQHAVKISATSHNRVAEAAAHYKISARDLVDQLLQWSLANPDCHQWLESAHPVLPIQINPVSDTEKRQKEVLDRWLRTPAIEIPEVAD